MSGFFEHTDERPAAPSKCKICGQPATWLRSINFTHDQAFCTVHAHAEKDFGSSSHGITWMSLTAGWNCGDDGLDGL